MSTKKSVTQSNQSYATLNFRLKKILEDVIDVAYKGESLAEISRYKGFKFYVVAKECRTYGGRYLYDGHKIEVYNPSLGTKHLAKCALHELSHHIDFVKNGTSGHQKPFYAEYRKLIYATLDMGILSKDDFTNDEWSSDRNKVKKIVQEYRPSSIDYKSTGSVIKVYNAFSIKDSLKSIGYKWNGIEQVWEKSCEDEASEVKLLENMNVSKKGSGSETEYEIKSADLYVDPVVYITVDGKTYEARETLKLYGFYYSGDKKRWFAKGTPEEMNNLLLEVRQDLELKGCMFKVTSK